MQLIYNNFFDLYKKILDKYKKGEGKGIKWICSINEESIDLVKIFLKVGMKLRHVKSLTPMNFAIGDKELNATVESMQGGKMVQSLLTSNEPIYIKHFSSLFKELWHNGIDADDRIRDIEEGVDAADIEIIHNPKEGIKRAWSMIKTAKEEVLIMFSTSNVLHRQIQMGGLQLLKEASEKPGVRVRLLIPADERLTSTIKQVKSTYPEIDIRRIETNLHIRITIVLVDKKECIIIELKDDTKDISYSAAGLATYSNSKSIVSSYASIFESFWKQTKLYEQLGESNKQLELANEQLKINDKMQKEFINIAAHELRTPIQPILGLAEVLSSKKGSIEQYNELIDAIIRNARRLQRLTEDILDVTRIESNLLTLNKQQFNLKDIITNTINDIIVKKDFKSKNIQLLYEPKDIFVEADRSRLTQVISNLLSNSVKFTIKGIIKITTKIKDDKNVILSIKDTGSGINSEIFPRLFSKFATKSDIGTGLGLFITKSIVEAHGGKISAENNAEGKGATFVLVLPVINLKMNHQ
jgi:two-component system, OmpR family, sensor histidine kinase VicK